jgi:hypothetical protein
MLKPIKYKTIKHLKKQKGQSNMDNPETLTTMCKKYPDRRQAKKPFCFFKCLIVLYLIGFSMGTLSIEGYNTEYRGFLPTNDTSKLELIFC